MSKKNKLSLILTYTAAVSRERGIRKARVFFLRSLLYSLVSFRWLEFIDAYYKKCGFDIAPWTLVGLPVRKYASSTLNTSQKISLLENHYDLLFNFLKPAQLNLILKGESVNLSDLTAKNGEVFSIKLAVLERYWREGGLTIFITDKEKDVITTLTFSLGKKENGENFMMIGGLQGTISGKSKIVSTTRMLNGLRPKYAVLECAYAVAEFFNVKSIIATSVKNHIFGGKKYAYKINSDYDHFWEEVGGTRLKDGNFQLPITLPKRSLEEVPSKKKKDWLKRQEYLAQIKADTKNCL